MAIWSEQNDRDDGYGFPAASEPWVPEILVTLLPISAYISIYIHLLLGVSLDPHFLLVPQVKYLSAVYRPRFLLPSRSTERPQAIAITTEFEISKAKTIRKAAGMSKPCCRSCLEISIWSFNWQLKRFFRWILIDDVFTLDNAPKSSVCFLSMPLDSYGQIDWIVMDSYRL